MTATPWCLTSAAPPVMVAGGFHYPLCEGVTVTTTRDPSTLYHELLAALPRTRRGRVVAALTGATGVRVDALCEKAKEGR